MQSAADGRKEFAALIYSSSHNTRDFRRGIRAQKDSLQKMRRSHADQENDRSANIEAVRD